MFTAAPHPPAFTQLSPVSFLNPTLCCRGHPLHYFSCKRRGLCPTCDAKRAAVIAADAADRLLPPVPYRQWVLVIPKRLRWYINQRPDLAGELSRVFAGEINRFLRKNADGAPAQLHFIQRFGESQGKRGLSGKFSPANTARRAGGRGGGVNGASAQGRACNKRDLF